MATLGMVLPALDGFFDGARGPNARNLISVSLVGARNYAVANGVRTRLVFTESLSNGKRRVRIHLTKYDSGTFTAVGGQEPRYLPVGIVVSTSGAGVVVCFLPVGQLSVASGYVRDLYLYDSAYDIDNPRELDHLYINYYTGELIGQ